MKEISLRDMMFHIDYHNGFGNIMEISNKLTIYEKFYLKYLMYLNQVYKSDKLGYSKYSYDFILGLTKRELTISMQNTIMNSLIDSEFVEFKKVNNKVKSFKLDSSKIDSLIEEIRSRVVEINQSQTNLIKKSVKYKAYIIEDEHTHLFKIGRSKDVSNRYKTLQSRAPLLKLIMKSESDCEKMLHEKFKDKRVRGEWFKLEKSDLDLLLSEFNFKSCEDEESK